MQFISEKIGLHDWHFPGLTEQALPALLSTSTCRTMFIKLFLLFLWDSQEQSSNSRNSPERKSKCHKNIWALNGFNPTQWIFAEGQPLCTRDLVITSGSHNQLLGSLNSPICPSDRSLRALLGTEKGYNSLTTCMYKLIHTRHLAFANKADFRCGDF